MRTVQDITHLLLVATLAMACSSSSKLQKGNNALTNLLNDSALVQAHVGVHIVEAESGKVLAGHNDHRYFVPASNTKLWTMYAGMKYLGDSLIAGYVLPMNDSMVILRSNGDPTFLHPEYPYQPLAKILSGYKQVGWVNGFMRTTMYGNGWSWNDYDATYMAPRSSLPMYGNVARISLNRGEITTDPSSVKALVNPYISMTKLDSISIFRKFDNPKFSINPGHSKWVNVTLYLDPATNQQLAAAHFENNWFQEQLNADWVLHPIYSQPTDSMLRPLMHRSDNFFAEQTLLMISHQWFGYMDEKAVIDSLLKTDLQGMPDKPRWVDGSGLSRYNLFSPADYVWLLQKMKTEFPMKRLQDVLPTGNDGTLTNYYKTLEGKIFAKTGTLGGVVALSGYLYAKSGKLLLFSTLVNNHNGSAPAVRRAVEKYLLAVYEKH